MGENKNARGNSAQFFVAGELCRRNLVAVVTMGNTPNTDILCSNTAYYCQKDHLLPLKKAGCCYPK